MPSQFVFQWINGFWTPIFLHDKNDKTQKSLCVYVKADNESPHETDKYCNWLCLHVVQRRGYQYWIISVRNLLCAVASTKCNNFARLLRKITSVRFWHVFWWERGLVYHNYNGDDILSPNRWSFSKASRVRKSQSPLFIHDAVIWHHSDVQFLHFGSSPRSRKTTRLTKPCHRGCRLSQILRNVSKAEVPLKISRGSVSSGKLGLFITLDLRTSSHSTQ